jgi:hypothetical protein
MGKEAMNGSNTVNCVPSGIGTRVPVFMVQFLANLAALSAFVVALMFSSEDRKLLAHFLQQGDILSRHVIVFNALCFAFYSIVFAAVLMLLPLGIMGLVDDGIDTMIVKAAFFGTACTYLCHALALSVPPLCSSRVLLLTFLPMTLFAGAFFPWDNLSTLFRVLHCMNHPLFCCLLACTHLLLATFEPSCDPHACPCLICAAPNAIREVTQLQDLGSTESQLFSAGPLLLSMFFLSMSHRHKPTHSKLTQRERLARHDSMNVIAPPATARQQSRGSQSVLSSWLDTSRESL